MDDEVAAGSCLLFEVEHSAEPRRSARPAHSRRPSIDSKVDCFKACAEATVASICQVLSSVGLSHYCFLVNRRVIRPSEWQTPPSSSFPSSLPRAERAREAGQASSPAPPRPFSQTPRAKVPRQGSFEVTVYDAEHSARYVLFSKFKKHRLPSEPADLVGPLLPFLLIFAGLCGDEPMMGRVCEFARTRGIPVQLVSSDLDAHVKDPQEGLLLAVLRDMLIALEESVQKGNPEDLRLALDSMPYGLQTPQVIAAERRLRRLRQLEGQIEQAMCLGDAGFPKSGVKSLQAAVWQSVSEGLSGCVLERGLRRLAWAKAPLDEEAWISVAAGEPALSSVLDESGAHRYRQGAKRRRGSPSSLGVRQRACLLMHQAAVLAEDEAQAGNTDNRESDSLVATLRDAAAGQHPWEYLAKSLAAGRELEDLRNTLHDVMRELGWRDVDLLQEPMGLGLCLEAVLERLRGDVAGSHSSAALRGRLEAAVEEEQRHWEGGRAWDRTPVDDPSMRSWPVRQAEAAGGGPLSSSPHPWMATQEREEAAVWPPIEETSLAEEDREGDDESVGEPSRPPSRCEEPEVCQAVTPEPLPPLVTRARVVQRPSSAPAVGRGGQEDREPEEALRRPSSALPALQHSGARQADEGALLPTADLLDSARSSPLLRQTPSLDLEYTQFRWCGGPGASASPTEIETVAWQPDIAVRGADTPEGSSCPSSTPLRAGSETPDQGHPRALARPATPLEALLSLPPLPRPRAPLGAVLNERESPDLVALGGEERQQWPAWQADSPSPEPVWAPGSFGVQAAQESHRSPQTEAIERPASRPRTSLEAIVEGEEESPLRLSAHARAARVEEVQARACAARSLGELYDWGLGRLLQGSVQRDLGGCREALEVQEQPPLPSRPFSPVPPATGHSPSGRKASWTQPLTFDNSDFGTRSATLTSLLPADGSTYADTVCGPQLDDTATTLSLLEVRSLDTTGVWETMARVRSSPRHWQEELPVGDQHQREEQEATLEAAPALREEDRWNTDRMQEVEALQDEEPLIAQQELEPAPVHKTEAREDSFKDAATEVVSGSVETLDTAPAARAEVRQVSQHTAELQAMGHEEAETFLSSGFESAPLTMSEDREYPFAAQQPILSCGVAPEETTCEAAPVLGLPVHLETGPLPGKERRLSGLEEVNHPSHLAPEAGQHPDFEPAPTALSEKRDDLLGDVSRRAPLLASAAAVEEMETAPSTRSEGREATDAEEERLPPQVPELDASPLPLELESRPASRSEGRQAEGQGKDLDVLSRLGHPGEVLEWEDFATRGSEMREAVSCCSPSAAMPTAMQPLTLGPGGASEPRRDATLAAREVLDTAVQQAMLKLLCPLELEAGPQAPREVSLSTGWALQEAPQVAASETVNAGGEEDAGDGLVLLQLLPLEDGSVEVMLGPSPVPPLHSHRSSPSRRGAPLTARRRIVGKEGDRARPVDNVEDAAYSPSNEVPPVAPTPPKASMEDQPFQELSHVPLDAGAGVPLVSQEEGPQQSVSASGVSTLADLPAVLGSVSPLGLLADGLLPGGVAASGPPSSASALSRDPSQAESLTGTVLGAAVLESAGLTPVAPSGLPSRGPRSRLRSNSSLDDSSSGSSCVVTLHSPEVSERSPPTAESPQPTSSVDEWLATGPSRASTPTFGEDMQRLRVRPGSRLNTSRGLLGSRCSSAQGDRGHTGTLSPNRLLRPTSAPSRSVPSPDTAQEAGETQTVRRWPADPGPPVDAGEAVKAAEAAVLEILSVVNQASATTAAADTALAAAT